MKQLIAKIETLINEYASGSPLLKDDIRLSKNFLLSEFNCKCHGRTKADCGDAVKAHPELVRRLQAIRDEAGVPVNLNSGFRCPSHNARVGGSENSQHMLGRAADFWLRGKPLSEAIRLAEKYFPDGGVGYYNTFVHVDVRGVKARWDNRT